MANIEVEVGRDGVAVATLDVADRSMNTITAEVQIELAALANRIRDDGEIVGLILMSGKPTGFCAGADLGEMASSIERWREAGSQQELRKGVEEASTFSRCIRALETCGKPVVTIVAGVALGGGLELALAGHRRIGIGEPSSMRLGLPEATIGLMPGGGATQRLTRLLGVAAALPYLLDGTPLAPAFALESGILHALTTDQESALTDARAWILSGPDFTPPWDAKGFKLRDAPHSPGGYATLPYLLANARGDGARDHAARANILRAVYEGVQVNIDAGLRIEARYFFNTVRAPEAAAMVRTLFTSKQAVGSIKNVDLEPLRERIGAAWLRASEELVVRGHPASLVRGVARSLSTELPTVQADDGGRSYELPKDDDRLLIRHELLSAAGVAARTALEDGVTKDEDQTDVLALELGFPRSTGGPLSYLRHHAVG